MSKEIVVEGWVSVVPDAMYKGWIKNKYITKGASRISTAEKGKEKGYCVVKEDIAETIKKEITLWYKDVFLYVEEWLKKHEFIDLQKGSFRGGFCAEETENDAVKHWGAPLSGPRNKVCQIKEKFGRITVYFNPISKQERAKVKRFARYVENKFDCLTTFC